MLVAANQLCVVRSGLRATVFRVSNCMLLDVSCGLLGMSSGLSFLILHDTGSPNVGCGLWVVGYWVAGCEFSDCGLLERGAAKLEN